ncbi:coiled-coil domain-containing protein 157 isoform 1-T2 [Synchiropus picturatus]
MTQFLGRQDCMDSLRRDLVDLQGAIVDVFSKTGPVQCPSWKFPDKLSCNLDMVSLLDQYDHVEGEDAFNQHAHIVLLELVIDRLLLLLQSFDSYVEAPGSSQQKRSTQQKGCISIGLVVIKYWSHLVEFTQNKIMSPETGPSNVIEAIPNSCNLSLSPTDPVESHPCSTDVVSHSASCQTGELPCDACNEVQSVLRQTGAALVGLFTAEGLPSSMQSLLAASEDHLEPGQMTDVDVAQWASEQLRDLRRLGKHIREVRETVQPLKKQLTAAEEERERLRLESESAIKQLETEVKKYSATVTKLEKTQTLMKDKEEKLLEEKKQLQTELFSLKKSHSTLEEKLTLQQQSLQAHQAEQVSLLEKVRTLQMEEDLCGKLQKRVVKLQRQLSEQQLLYEKEKAKYQSACRQQESMQVKQNSLLERVDTLDVECEELHRQLGLKEEAELELYSQLQEMSREKEHVLTQLTPQKELCVHLERDKRRLESDVGDLKRSVDDLQELVQSLEERERLLVAFPELSPLTLVQPQSTGNVLLDMEQQFQANSIRIKVLERENVSLHTSLVKLKERAQGDEVEDTSHPLSSGTSPGHSQVLASRTSSAQSSSEAISADLEICRWSESPTPTASPPSVKLHLQTLELKTDAMKASARKHRTSHSAPSRVYRLRRK